MERRREIKSGKGRPKTLYKITREVTGKDLKNIAILCDTYGNGEKQRSRNEELRMKYNNYFKRTEEVKNDPPPVEPQKRGDARRAVLIRMKTDLKERYKAFPG